MLPKYHILFGAIFSIIVYIVFGLTTFQTSLIFLASFLIDVDHYLFYAFKKKDINPIRAVKWFVKKREKWISLQPKERRKAKFPLIILHGIEFWILLIALSYINILFLFILIGVLFHMVLDFIELAYIREPFYSKLSQIYVYSQNHNKEDLVEFIERFF